MSSNIVVYIIALTPDINSERIQALSNLFDPLLYNVKVRYIPPPVNLIPTVNLTPNDQILNYRIITVLQEAQKNDGNAYTLTLLESSRTVTDRNTLNLILSTAVSTNDFDPITMGYRWQILYLTHWLADCRVSEYDIITVPPTDPTSETVPTTTILTRSRDLLGTQSYLITPQGRLMLLGLEPMLAGQNFTPIMYPIDVQLQLANTNEGIRIWMTLPNVFEYDTYFNLEYNLFVHRTWSCKMITETEEDNGSSSDNWFDIQPLIIAVVVIILIIVFAWAIIRIGPDDSEYSR